MGRRGLMDNGELNGKSGLDGKEGTCCQEEDLLERSDLMAKWRLDGRNGT